MCLENPRAEIYVPHSDHVRIPANRSYSQPCGLLKEDSMDRLMVKDNDLRANTSAAMSLVGANRIVGDSWET
ncbi:MAG: hypothetical protein ACT4OI_04800 [Methanobacteriota archaeon]